MYSTVGPTAHVQQPLAPKSYSQRLNDACWSQQIINKNSYWCLKVIAAWAAKGTLPTVLGRLTYGQLYAIRTKGS